MVTGLFHAPATLPLAAKDFMQQPQGECTLTAEEKIIPVLSAYSVRKNNDVTDCAAVNKLQGCRNCGAIC
jgi:hypothetical protein